MTKIEGLIGETPPCPSAKFNVNDVLRVRRRKHLGDLQGKLCAVAAVVPPGYSPDWAMADLRQTPRPLMAQVGARCVTYIVGFEDNPKPYLFPERYLTATSEPAAEIRIERP
jgi:hypothetical protein